MNLVLLTKGDFIDDGLARIAARRLGHVRKVHRVEPETRLSVGLVDGLVGEGLVTRMDQNSIEMKVTLGVPPPPKLPLTLVLALPRPKVLGRILAGATSLGVSRIYLVNAWRVEKAYWKSPRLAPSEIVSRCIEGLEQGRDTVLPAVLTRRLLRSFAEQELPQIASGTTSLVAHPRASRSCPAAVDGPVTLLVGPEGGFIDDEIAMFERVGILPVRLGPRILRVETAVCALVGRLCP